MPSNRTRRSRKRECIIELDESIEKYFLTGEVERGTPAWEIHVSRHFDGGEKIRLAWLQHKEFLLKKWKSEGRGPFRLERCGDE